ncbi:hypothetical protein VPNG_00297 [Cytospora leucostoma]|uniref:SnoaL-like domain-containing protein n=1 Tax=Cytospora leucostoma TaxID=1230097 RepID=A0A423XPE5_9PEZI|nr:hypothetical protein VPNG_00297 [Cytospora leucostoma]
MALPPYAAETIRRKKSQYCRFLDTKQWHLFDKIALPDANFDFVGPEGNVLSDGGVPFSWSNTKGFTSHFKKAFETVQTIHSIGPGELEQIGPGEVKAIWTVIYHLGPQGSADAKHHGTGGGNYHEIWKKQGDDWFLADLRLERFYWIFSD